LGWWPGLLCLSLVAFLFFAAGLDGLGRDLVVVLLEQRNVLTRLRELGARAVLSVRSESLIQF
jgi:hypothetical protein